MLDRTKMPPHNFPSSPISAVLQNGDTDACSATSQAVQVFFPPRASIPAGLPIAVAIPCAADTTCYQPVYSPVSVAHVNSPCQQGALAGQPPPHSNLVVSCYQDKGTTYFYRKVSLGSPGVPVAGISPPMSMSGLSPPMSVAGDATPPRSMYPPTPTLRSAASSPVGPTALNKYQTSTVNGQSVTTQLELVWHGEFNSKFRHFNQYGSNWDLIPKIARGATPTREEGYSQFRDSAKVRFTCSKCGKGWTSMKGRVQFWYRLCEGGQGEVVFELFGQQCAKCKDGFEHAMWYPEEVVKVVENVFHRVGQSLYNFPKPIIRVDRRQGKPKEQHDSSLCQACQDGVCGEEWATA